MAQRYRLKDGTLVEAQPDGTYREVVQPSAMTIKPSPPGFQYQGAQAAANLQRTMQEVRQAQATAAATTREKNAQATSAEIKAKTDKENYDAAHPKGPTGTVIGPDSLKNLPVPDQEIVKALADGRLAFPAGFALKAPWWQQKLEQVAQYDPTFDATNFNNRAKARATLLNGKVGASANALNTAIGHLDLLNSQVAGTASHSFTPANAVINSVEQMFGDSGITNFKDTAGKLASELTSVYRNGGGAEADVVRQLQSLNPNASLKQKTDIVRNAIELLASKQAANLYQYNIGSGGKPEVDLLDPAARAVLDKFPDVRDKYFAPPAGPLSAAAAALLKGNGGSPPPGAPPGSPPGAPPAGPSLTPAGGATRTVASLTPADKKIAAMLASGAPSADIRKYAAANDFPTGNVESVLAWRALNPTYKGSYDVHSEKIVPTTLAERAAASPLSALPYGIANAATGGILDEIKGGVNTLSNGGSLADNIASANLEKQTIASGSPGLDLTGNVIGGAATMLGGGAGLKALLAGGAKGGIGRNILAWAARNPVKAAAVGDAGYGAGYGAGENNDNRLLGGAVGGVTGLVASPIGSALSNGAGKLIQGVVNPAAQRLSDARIPLTAGEVIGGGAKKLQDAATSLLLGPGSMVARRYADGRRALNEAAFNEAGQTIGAPINAVGQDGINALDAAKSQAYSQALDPVSLNLNTPSFVDPMRGVMAGASEIPAGELPEGYAANTIDRFVGNNIAPDGTMTGPDFQKAYRGLAQTANRAAPKVEGFDVGQALGHAKDILASTLQDQNPGAFEGFQKANQANRMLNILAAAHNAAKNQITDGGEVLFTPAQLNSAATANAQRFGGNVAAASGAKPFNQLAQDAQQVMSSKLPDSGSASRILATKLLGTGALLGGSGSAGYGVDGSEGAEGAGLGTALALTLGGSKVGQQLLTAALMKRTLADQAAAKTLLANPHWGAGALTSLGVPLLDSPSR